MVSLYNTGLELANLLLGSDLLNQSWDAISNLQKQNLSLLEDPSLPFSVKYQVYENPSRGSIIAFVCSPNSALNHLQQDFRELISSDEITSFDFLCKKNNSFVSIHKAAFALFASLENELSLLKQQFTSNQPLIVTGYSLGGSVASLFTLWLLDSLPRYGVQRSLCITFGSPLLGNSGFQKAISDHPTWSSCFLHVVSDKDPVPRFLISDHNASDGALTTPTYYMPFGTYLFGSESGFSCFEEPQSILELLMIMSSRCAESENLNNCYQVIDYGHILEQLKNKTICRGISELPESISNPLQAGTYLLLEATGAGKLQENVNLSYLAMNIAKRAEVQAKHKQKVFDPYKISITKKSMSYLEWYIRNSLEEAGYYDKYKTRRSRSRDEIESTENLIKHHRTVKLFWKRTVTEVENLPWKEGRIRRIRLLYAATNYRRMVEPLDIAEYYGRGKNDYVSHGRSEHYKLLEEWVTGGNVHTYQRSQAPTLTVDSCFWAYVEEALISCEVLKDGQSSSPQDQESARENLIKFEQYVMDMINNFLVSPEIFLSQSSFMLWWREYSRLVGNSYTSPLTNFMKDGFRQYA